MDLNNKIDLIKYFYDEYNFIQKYILKISIRGYTKNEYKILYSKLQFINKVIQNLIYTSLELLLAKCSNRRLKKIICGEDLIIDILNIPMNYKLIIDINNIEEYNTLNSLVFISKNKKYGLLKHKDFTKEGLSYINGKWQKI